MVYFIIFLVQFVLLFFLSRVISRSLSLLIFQITKNQYSAIRIFHFLFLPGVLIHELAHLVTAEVMFVKTGGLNLSPQRDGDQVRMGSVQIQKTDPVRRAIIGFAPVFVGFIIICLTTFFFLSDKSPLSPFVNYVIVFFVVFEIGNTMFSSKKDLEGTVELLIFFAIVLAAFYILGFKFPDIQAFLNQAKSQELLLKGVKVLSIPIIINLIIIFFAKFILVKR